MNRYQTSEIAMKQKLLAYLRCPLCRTSFTVEPELSQVETITSGTLTCANAHTFAVENGIPIMLSPELPGYAVKMGEAEGWVKMSKDLGWYQSSAEIDLALPDVVAQLGWDPADASSWLSAQYSFSHLMQHLVKPGMRILEIGAARTWTGRFFAEAGCEYTACDIVVDPEIGLGRGYFFMEHFNCHYDLVGADGEYLPFANNTFDLVFAISALHHAIDLPQMVREMARVTKWGGIVAGISEGVRAFESSPEAELQAQEKTYGINEHVHTLWDYYRAFLRSRLWVTKIYRAVGYEWFMADFRAKRVARWDKIPLLGEWIKAIDIMGYAHEYDGVTLYSRKLF